MQGALKISIENSATPIYRRIIDCLAKSLRERRHQVSIEVPQQHSSFDAYINSQIAKELDYILITNPCSLTSSYIEALDAFCFELLPHRLIFLHHDNWLARPECDYGLLVKLYSAYQKTSERSHHFCIESSNCHDLRLLGVAHAHPIRHASEFNLHPHLESTELGTSFVGHVLNLPLQLTNPAISHRVQRDYWSRICDLSYSIEASAQEFMQQNSKTQDIKGKLAAKAAYMSLVHYHSVFMRGEVFQRIGEQNITIFGGDPAYLSGSKMSRRLEGSQFSYRPPTRVPEETAEVYNNSLVNINITPFQFDTCVINRVIDIGAAGGFPLTDWRDDLATLTSVHKEISYRSPEELEAKIAYYAHASHQKERLEICATFHQEIHANNTYDIVVDDMLAKLKLPAESEDQAMIQIKPEIELESWNLDEELRDINILVHLNSVDICHGGEEYARLQQLLAALTNDKNSGKICLLVGSKVRDTEESSNILAQLMLDLLAADQVPFAQDPPNLIPAPTSQSRLDQLRPYLAYELPLVEISIDAIQNIISLGQNHDH
jgi:hypothetical protein